MASLAAISRFEAFRHRASWNEPMSRIEMPSGALRDSPSRSAAAPSRCAPAETIHPRNSHKYGPRDARLLLRAAGWIPVKDGSGEDDAFALILAEGRSPALRAPSAPQAAPRHCPTPAPRHMADRAAGALMLIALFQIVDMLLKVLSWIIIIQAIMSWLVAFQRGSTITATSSAACSTRSTG